MSGQQQLVTELRAADVLLGRGSGPNDHEGNIRFRQLVAERKAEYMATNHRLTKAKIAQEIVDSVYQQNGRFLRKLEPDEVALMGIPDGQEVYVMAHEDTIMEKAKQALRQNANKGNKAKGEPLTNDRVSSPPRVHTRDASSASQATVQVTNQRLKEYDDFEPIPLQRPGYQRSDAPPISMPLPAVVQSQPHEWNAPRRAPAQQSHIPEDDSILAHLPPSVMAQFGQDSSLDNGSNHELSMAHIPDDMPRRGSMTMGDLAKWHNRRNGSGGRGPDTVYTQHQSDAQMSGLLDSFSKMQTKDEHRKMYASTETMGTIEPIGVGSMADMSLATMESSMFSFYKGNESTLETSGSYQDKGSPTRVYAEVPATAPEPAVSGGYSGSVPAASNLDSKGSLSNVSKSWFMSDSSFTVADASASRRRSNMGAAGHQSSMMTSAIFENNEYDPPPAEISTSTASVQPRPLRLMEEQPDELNLDQFGNSSMSILKAAFTSTGTFDLPRDDSADEYADGQQRETGRY